MRFYLSGLTRRWLPRPSSGWWYRRRVAMLPKLVALATPEGGWVFVQRAGREITVTPARAAAREFPFESAEALTAALNAAGYYAVSLFPAEPTPSAARLQREVEARKLRVTEAEKQLNRLLKDIAPDLDKLMI